MPAVTTKGLDRPQQRDRSFVGAWLKPATKKRVVGAAMLRGVSVNQLINEWAESLEVSATERAATKEQVPS